MEARALRLPMLSVALSLSVSFCARADICFDTMSGVQYSAYIDHIDEDDNVIEVEITGNCKVKSLHPAGDSGDTGIPRDKLRIRIPEIKLNFVEIHMRSTMSSSKSWKRSSVYPGSMRDF